MQNVYSWPEKYLYSMLIRMTKNTGKRHVIKYIRDNGTETWMHADDFFVRHDLSHYAIESVLQYRTAFNGMLNGGMDIKDFEDKEKRERLQVTDEAWYAENLANLFLAEIAQGPFEDFNTVQQQAFTNFNQQYIPVTLSHANIAAIRLLLRRLLQQWAELKEGQTMELIFSV